MWSAEQPEPGEEGPARAARLGVHIADPAPLRGPDEGAGPYSQLVITNVVLVNGEGAPPRGPVNIVIEQDRIVRIDNGEVPAAADHTAPLNRRIQATS